MALCAFRGEGGEEEDTKETDPVVEVDVEASNERWPQRDLFGTDQSPAGPIAG